MDGASLDDWLSSPDNPPVRYLTARDLLDPSMPEEALAALRAAAVAWEPVQRILALQAEDGRFPVPGKRLDAPTTLTCIGLLARCGLDARDPPVGRALRWLFGRHVVKGAYSQNTGGSGILPCYLGYFVPIIAAVAGPDVEPVRTSVDWLLRHQRFDHKETRAGGDEEWPFRTPINYGCWFSVSCYHGVAAALRAIASIPAAGRTDVDRRRLDEAVAYLRIHRVYKKSAVDKPLFRHLTQFFLHGGYRFHLIDVLEGLAWTDPALGRQEWVAEAIEAVDALAPDGRIRLVKNYPTHLIDPIPLEPVGEPSRFLTYQWLRTKRRFGLP